MVSVRAAKQKGSAMEYDCQHSLELAHGKGTTVTRTSERGFQMQYDLRVENDDMTVLCIECKRLKGISWNQLVKFHEKLVQVVNSEKERLEHEGKLYYPPILLFKSNRQPCLVFHKDDDEYTIQTFESYFDQPFTKHPSTRVKVKK